MKVDERKCKIEMAKKFIDIKTLSEITGLTYKSVNQIIRGISEPRMKNLEKICAALDCNAMDILEDAQKEPDAKRVIITKNADPVFKYALLNSTYGFIGNIEKISDARKIYEKEIKTGLIKLERNLSYTYSNIAQK